MRKAKEGAFRFQVDAMLTEDDSSRPDYGHRFSSAFHLLLIYQADHVERIVLSIAVSLKKREPIPFIDHSINVGESAENRGCKKALSLFRRCHLWGVPLARPLRRPV
jgi:hypothetical protein